MPPLYILRHAETEFNAAGRLQGRFDSPLTDLGRAQAISQGQILQRENLDGFQALCSPQGRALETARIVLEGVLPKWETDSDLAEIGLGDWAGCDRETLMAQSGAADGFALYALAPGGEGFEALHRRCTAFLARLSGPSVLITHGITSRMLRLILTGQGIENLRDMAGGQGVVFHISDGVQHRLSLGA